MASSGRRRGDAQRCACKMASGHRGQNVELFLGGTRGQRLPLGLSTLNGNVLDPGATCRLRQTKKPEHALLPVVAPVSENRGSRKRAGDLLSAAMPLDSRRQRLSTS